MQRRRRRIRRSCQIHSSNSNSSNNNVNAASATVFGCFASLQPIRHFRFRSKIISSNLKNQAPKNANSSKRQECYEINCRINCGDFRQVEVEFNSNSRKNCAFSWKRKLRNSLSRSSSSSSSSLNVKQSRMKINHKFQANDYFEDVYLAAADEREFRVKSPTFQYCNEERFGSTQGSDDDNGSAAANIGIVEKKTLLNSSEIINNNSEAAEETINDKDLIDFFSNLEYSKVNSTSDECDNNRITPPTNKANISKLESTTEQVLENGVINNNNLIEKSGSNTRTNSRTSSPILNTSNVKKIPASSTAPTCSSSDKKSQSSRLLNSTSSATTRKVALHKQHQQLSEESPTTAESDDLQQMKILNRHSYNGPLNYQTFEEQKLQLQQLQKQTEYQNKSTEALGVLLQYLVYDLDAFACPTLKSENSKSKEKLKKTLLLLDETKSACSELQDQICEKEAYYTQREDELQVLHRCELEKAHSSLSEFQHIAKQQITELKSQIHAKDAENKSTLDSYCLEMENKLAQKQQQLLAAEEKERTLQLRLTNAEQAEQQLQEKISQIESSYSNRLQRSVENEFQLSERVKTLTKELDNLKSIKEHRERELKDKLNLSNDEISILRTSRRSLNESGVGSPRNCSSVSSASHMEISRLQSEAESLRCVLELKQKEISKLTKHNEELLRDADERNALQAKISLLESKNEMLQSELEIKSDKEKEYLRQIDEVQKAFSHETVKRTRLSYDNEALQWQLKQRSEQLHIVETKLHELSANDTCHSSLTNRSSLNGSSIMGSTHVEEISPPASPVIKAVIEKNDSVSWVLEMDDETPEVAASKMVKRAGSFRSVERSPSTRRQLSLSATASCGSAANSSNSLVIAPVNPNPLSQSMSATSVIREHSKNETIELSNRLHPRMRSKSVSVKSCDGSTIQLPQQKSSKKLSRQLSGGSALKPEAVNSWKESVVAASSSPYTVRPRTSTLKIEDEQDEVLFRRSSASKLITCDTSALNKGERLEMRSLPSHPSVHDLKTAKKCQEIQESAGEAMVSGTNSEDESCSASSDDVVSTASSSAASDSTTSSNQLKNSHMSFEEALLIEKMNSQAGTPMEVSWSEDVEGMPASSNTLQL